MLIGLCPNHTDAMNHVPTVSVGALFASGAVQMFIPCCRCQCGFAADAPFCSRAGHCNRSDCCRFAGAGLQANSLGETPDAARPLACAPSPVSSRRT